MGEMGREMGGSFKREGIYVYLWLIEAQAGIKIARRNINNIRCADDTTLMVESEEELESVLMKVKEKSKKAGLKPNGLVRHIISASSAM